MSSKKSFLLIFCTIILLNCKKEVPIKKIDKIVPAPNKELIEKKETVEDKLKVLDSINETNAIDFLIAYGQEHKETKLRLKTRLGTITILLYEDTPLHRANFLFLTKVGYFDTTCFHRVVPDFIVQGGNSESLKTLRIRNQYRNYTVPPEFRKHRKHKYGALAAAREWENNISKKSNPFEFYFIQSKKGAYHIDGEHTVFGEVVSGFKVLDKIANERAGRDEWPLEDVYMEIEILE